MIQKCGVDYNADRPNCGRSFDDAERWTFCPHPALEDRNAVRVIEAYTRGDTCPMCHGTKELHVVGSLMQGMPYPCIYCKE